MKLADLLETTCRWIYPGTFAGKRYRLYESKFLAVFEGQGTTKDAAEQDALQAAKDAGANMGKRQYFFSPSGKTTFVVYFDRSWCYDIASATRAPQENRCACCSMESFEVACRMAEGHAKDYED